MHKMSTLVPSLQENVVRYSDREHRNKECEV